MRLKLTYNYLISIALFKLAYLYLYVARDINRIHADTVTVLSQMIEKYTSL